MKLTGQEFKASRHKAITLLGMSGVGKTYLSSLLENWGWGRYSCDYEIGNKYLAPHLVRTIDSVEDISALSKFIGRPGRTDKGGLPYEKFKERQEYYYEAECAALSAVPDRIIQAQDEGHANFIHDSTGSLCEILNELLLEKLGQETLFVYLKAGKEEEELVLARAMKTPKPLFFPPFQLESWVGHFMEENNLKNTDEMVPDEFSRWVFPKLFASRLPKYQRLADLYGVTIPCRSLYDVSSEEDFINRIAKALDG